MLLYPFLGGKPALPANAPDEVRSETRIETGSNADLFNYLGKGIADSSARPGV